MLASNRDGRRCWSSLTFWSVICVSLLTGWFVFRSWPLKYPNPWSTLEEEKYAQSKWSLESRLHPENHVGRHPTTFQYEWVLAEEWRRPDGVAKPVLTVNGQFPGPTLELRSGDTLHLKVVNKLPNESTAIHFHGIRHPSSNSMDGTPGLTQCPIEQGGYFWYNFTITPDQSGTFWWHSHSATQRADGLFGAFVIHKPGNVLETSQHISDELKRNNEDDVLVPFDYEARLAGLSGPETETYAESILLAGDWYHDTSIDMMKWYHSKRSHGFEPTPDNAIFNGVNLFDCSRAVKIRDCDPKQGSLPNIVLDPERSNRLRIVNTGILADLEFSLSGHIMTVIEADGIEVTPKTFGSIIVSPGQRYSVVLKPIETVTGLKGSAFTMKVSMSPECFNIPNPELELEQFILFSYRIPAKQLTKQASFDSLHRLALEPFSSSLLSPTYKVPIPVPDASYMIYVNSMKRDRLGGIPYGYINQSSWKADSTNPLLLHGALGQNEVPSSKDNLVVATHKKDTRVIELIINNIDEGPHPFHLHGHHFWPLASHRSTYGWGSYNYSAPPNTSYIEASPPVLRDTYSIPRRGYVVLRFVADSPGFWLFHCHVLVHLGTGMAMAFGIRTDLISAADRAVAAQSCGNIS